MHATMPVPSAATVGVVATVNHAAAVAVKATVAVRKAVTVVHATSAHARKRATVNATTIAGQSAILWAITVRHPVNAISRVRSAHVAAAYRALVHTATRCAAQADRGQRGLHKPR